MLVGTSRWCMIMCLYVIVAEYSSIQQVIDYLGKVAKLGKLEFYIMWSRVMMIPKQG